MVDEKTKTAPDKSKVVDTEVPKSGSADLVELARTEREGLTRENDRLEKNIAELRELEASRLLGSTAGGHIEDAPAKVETAKEYADRVMKNDVPLKKE